MSACLTRNNAGFDALSASVLKAIGEKRIRERTALPRPRREVGGIPESNTGVGRHGNQKSPKSRGKEKGKGQTQQVEHNMYAFTILIIQAVSAQPPTN